MIAPVLQNLAVRHAGRLKVVKVDVDANPQLAARHGARSIPLLVALRDEADAIARTTWSRAPVSRRGALAAPVAAGFVMTERGRS
jgi:hypothetical protein